MGPFSNVVPGPFSSVSYTLSVFVCRGYELGYELCLLGAKRCTLRQTQGDKKVPQIVEFVGLVCLLSGFVRLVQRRERDSNPRNPLGVYTLSRRASSTTRASLQGLIEIGCKGIDFF